MPLWPSLYAQIPIKIADRTNKQKPKNSIPIFNATNNEYKIADNSNKQKPKNSIPIFKATNKEYNIAVRTPAHSKILLFIKAF